MSMGMIGKDGVLDIHVNVVHTIRIISGKVVEDKELARKLTYDILYDFTVDDDTLKAIVKLIKDYADQKVLEAVRELKTHLGLYYKDEGFDEQFEYIKSKVELKAPHKNERNK